MLRLIDAALAARDAEDAAAIAEVAAGTDAGDDLSDSGADSDAG